MKTIFPSFSSALLAMLIPAMTLSAAEIEVTVEPAADSAADEFEFIPGDTPFTPCLSTGDGTVTFGDQEVDNPFDQFLITIEGSNDTNATTGALEYSLYVFLVNTAGDGSASDDVTNSQIFAFSRSYGDADGQQQVRVALVDTAANLDKAEDAHTYLYNTQMPGEDIEEILMGGNLAFDAYGLNEGTWVAVAILGDSSSIDFTDIKTWAAWDAFPFMLGAPWNTGGACD